MCCGQSCCHQRSMHDIKCRCCCDRCIKCEVCAGEDVEDYTGDILTSAVVTTLASQIFRPRRPSRKNPFLMMAREEEAREARRAAAAAAAEDYFLYEPDDDPSSSPEVKPTVIGGAGNPYCVSGVTTTGVKRLESCSSGDSTGWNMAALATEAMEARKAREAGFDPEEQSDNDDDDLGEGHRGGKHAAEEEEDEEDIVDVREGPAWREGYMERHLRKNGSVYIGDGNQEEEEDPRPPKYSTGLVWSMNNACSQQ